MITLAIAITLSCVLIVHLGLTDALMRVLRIDVDFLRCHKCMTFWSVLLMLSFLALVPDAWKIIGKAVQLVTLAFLCAYASLWVDLAVGKLNSIYNRWARRPKRR